MISRKISAAGVIIGLIAGVVCNLFLWISFPGLHWMWWNVFGVMIVTLVSTAVSAVKPDGQTKNIDQYVLRGTTFFKDERRWLPAYTTLIVYFVLMLAVLILLSWR